MQNGFSIAIDIGGIFTDVAFRSAGAGLLDAVDIEVRLCVTDYHSGPFNMGLLPILARKHARRKEGV